MTIDPSSIPNFGAPVPPQGPPPIIKPDQNLVSQLLDQVGLKYGTDIEGDLVASWSGFRVYLMFRGEGQELFAVRAFYEYEHPLEKKGELLDVVDEWNRDTLWPKVYTHTNEEGVVRLIGESQMTIPSGINIDYFVATTVAWIQAAVGFHGWVVDRLGLETEVESIETVDSALLNETPDAEGREASEGGDAETKSDGDGEKADEDEKAEGKKADEDESEG